MRIDWQNMGDILIGTHNNHASPQSFDTPDVKNVLFAFDVSAEQLFIIDKSITPLTGQQEGRHCFNGKRAVALLKDRPDIDYGIPIRTRRRVHPDRR